MNARGRSTEPGRGQRGTSRDSSVSSSGREVRCACQFFQTDSLSPERVTSVGRPPSRTSTGAMATQIGDHEYEPIAPPPVPQAARLAMDPDVETESGSPRGPFARTDSDEKRERRFSRIPLDDELVMMPGDGDAEDAAMRSRESGDLNGTHDEDEEEAAAAAAAAATAAAAAAAAAEEEDAESSAQEMQARMEERYFAATPTTTESRTDCDVNTSQLDSSGSEDSPLKRDSRKKKSSPDATADKQSQARGSQQRIRSQAGRIRTKLRSMSRPKFSMPERPKFNLPERPKFSMPSMPERPKFHSPERPKFNSPERPKFNLPERPKFSFPERPKFHLPERPKFNLPERPKFNLPQRPKLSMPTLSSLSRSSASTTNEKKKGTSSTRRPSRDRPSTLSSGSSSTKRTLFDFDSRTYPRIFDRKAKHADYATSSPKATRAQTPPPKMPSRRKGPVGSRWVHRFTDIKYADDENVPPPADDDVRMDISGEDSGAFDERPGSAHTESTTAFRDKDYGYAVTMEAPPGQPAPAAAPESIPESDREQRSSGSSSDRRRAGVLEEIDSDEFFSREKGLSQEDVDVGRYLTSEIRDAFRSPVSALSQMDKYEYYDEEDVENLGQRYRGTPEREPTRPARTRSLRPRKRENRTQKTPSPTLEKDANFYNTFPPARPKRARRQAKAAAEDDQEEKDQSEENIDGEGEIVHEYAEKMDDSEADAEVEAVGLGDASPAVSKRASPAVAEDSLDDESVGEADEEPRSEQWSAAAQHDDSPSGEFPPLAPKRKHRSRRESQEEDVVLNGHYTKEDWLENVEAEMEVEEPRGEPDYIIPASPEEEGEAVPVPPKRGRRHGSRGASLADEDRTSRGASSSPSEREPSEHESAAAAASEAASDAAGGYASVDKQPQQPPRPERPRRPKPPRPPPPGRRRRSAGGPRLTTNDVSHFFSSPRRAIRAPPVRPVRNYSTLGPARPPRRRAPEHEYVEQEQEQQERKSAAYMEIEDAEARSRREEAEDTHGSARDSQSGDVIEKMKTRPSPPPPRPPRKTREAAETSSEAEEASMEERSVGVSAAAEPSGALSDAVFYARQEETAPFTQIEEDAQAAASRESRESRDELAVGEAPLAAELDSEFEEVSVATQTDPSPDDVCVEPDEPHEPHPMADASTETYPAKSEMSEIKRTVIEAPPPPPPPEPVIVEKPVPYYVMPDPDTEVELKAQRLQVSESDVERSNVGELQAQKILVSDIDGMTMQVAELSSKSGHLVVSGIESPSGFSQELVDSRVAAATPPAPAAPAPAPIPISALSQAPTTASTPTPSAESTVLSSTAPAPQDSAPASSPEIACESQVPSVAIAPAAAAPAPAAAAPAASSAAPTAVPAAAPLAAPDAATAAAAAQIAAQLSAPFYLSHALHSLQGAPPEVLHSIIPEYFASSPRPSSRTRAHPASQRDSESEEESAVNIPPSSSSRRRRHARPPAQRYSSDEEEEDAGADHPPPSRRPPRVAAQAAAHAAPAASQIAPAASQALALPADASVVELGRQLVQACHAAVLRAIRHTSQYANSQSHDQEDKRRDSQVALCSSLVSVAGLILSGCFGSGQQHHHHWDFFFPPSR